MSAEARVLELIPHRPPFLFIDAILEERPDGLIARRTWRADEGFYQGHYPGAPITPGVLLCESVFQAGALHLASTLTGPGALAGMPLLVKISEVRFRSPVYPGDTVTIEVKRKDVLAGFYLLTGAMQCGDRRILHLEFSVAWKRPAGA